MDQPRLHPRPAAARLLLVVAVIAAMIATALGTPARAQATERLTNLDHLDYLTERVEPPAQEGHTTYRLDEMPGVGVLWTYAEPRDDGPYERIGGGSYDPETDTYSQGAFNADDISRAAVVYLRHWQQFGDDHSMEQAMALLRGLTYMQTIDGEDAGNVVLWMQPDGTLNPSAEPVELPDPSDSDASYWLARTIWALGEGYAAFADADPDFAAFLRERLDLAIGAVQRQALEPEYGETIIVDGLEWPAWLIANGADASSEAVYGLAAYVQATGDETAMTVLRQLYEGIADLQLGDVREWPFRAIMPFAEARTIWHAWGDQMAGALATASQVTGDEELLDAAVAEVASFTPHLLVQNGPENGWLPAPADRTQIAYGTDATLHNLLATYDATGDQAYLDLGGIAAAWYFGNNPAGEQMYDPATGRTFDGIGSDGTVNRNSGAESTIHGLLSMLALDARPELARAARVGDRTAQVTWQLVEAEDGLVTRGTVVEPESLWTGESLYTGTGYVELSPGGRTVIDVTLPTHDSYQVMPVFWREQTSDAVTVTRLGQQLAGAQWHGGAGEQGVTPQPGYADIGSGQTEGRVRLGHKRLEIIHAGGDDVARVDAALVQPDVEWLLLSGDDGVGQGLLRSFDTHRRVQRLQLEGAGNVTARSYDSDGELVSVRRGRDGWISAPVMPGGFTYVVSSSLR